MGHETVLIIGNNFRDQLAKFQRAEFAQPTNPNFGAMDYLETAKEEFAARSVSFYQAPDGSLHDYWSEKFYRTVEGGKYHFTPPGYRQVLIPVREIMTFTQWVKKNNGYPILQEREARDVNGHHKLGWNRVNANGDIIEMFAPTIPDAFFEYFESTPALLMLKPGACGTVIEYGEELPATNGYAGSANKGVIDFDAMGELMRINATQRWSRAKATAQSQMPQTWLTLKEIWNKYAHENTATNLKPQPHTNGPRSPL